MPEQRIIPAVETVAEFRIKVNGEELPRTIDLVGVHVTKVVNKISMAKFVVKEGGESGLEFNHSNGGLFIPGNQVEITAGSPEDQQPVFHGIIVKQTISVRGHRAAQLVVECRHQAFKATLVRKSSFFHDMTDSDAISEVLNASQLDGLEIETSSVNHPELVQYQCTDWDFALSRAEAVGKIILTNNEKTIVRSPELSATASLSLLYGATIIELDAEIDSRTQYKAVKAKAWDMSTQSLSETDATEPSLPDFGNLNSQDLGNVSGHEELVLLHGGALATDEMKTWADAQILKSRLAKVRGRVKFEGISFINPGDMLELHGLSDRFNGLGFVSGIRHDFSAQEGWRTQAQFGHSPEWFLDESSIHYPKAAGLLPGTNGLHIGIVTDNEDPDGEFRVRVNIPFLNPDDEGIWARMALSDAGNERGMYFRPEVNDEVIIGFMSDDPRQPIILGMLHSSALPSPLSPTNDNHQKGYTSREKLVLLFDDEKKSILVETPGGNKITLSDDDQGITVEDQNGNSLKMDASGISIQSAKKLELKAGTELIIGGPQLSFSADSTMEIKGGASTKVESQGALQIKGAIVQIN